MACCPISGKDVGNGINLCSRLLPPVYTFLGTASWPGQWELTRRRPYHSVGQPLLQLDCKINEDEKVFTLESLPWATVVAREKAVKTEVRHILSEVDCVQSWAACLPSFFPPSPPSLPPSISPSLPPYPFLSISFPFFLFPAFLFLLSFLFTYFFPANYIISFFYG